MSLQIKPNQYYSVRFLSNNKVFPWMTSHYTLTNYLDTEKGQLIFKPVIKQSVKHKRYSIKGETILEVLEQAKNGTLNL